MTEDRKTLLMIDTFGLLYKFYFTMPRMSTADGQPTHAVYGLARVLIKIADEMRPDYLVVTMESRIPTFRHDKYDRYKAHRDKIPDDLVSQLPIVEELFEAMGLVPAWKDGFEADDIIGTLSKAGSRENLDVRVITGDRDLLQLVDDNVRILLTKKGVSDYNTCDRDAVKEVLGVYPEQVIDKKGLEGDSSDNIPGVPGIGDKTARKLLDEFGTLERLYESLDKVKSKSQRKKLEENREQAFLSKWLATIVTDVELDQDIEDFRFKDFDRRALGKVLMKYSFKSLLNELGIEIEEEPEKTVAEQLGSKYSLCTDETQLVEMLRKAKEKKRLCIDLETMGLDFFDHPIVGYSLAVEPGEAIYVPVRHESDADENEDGEKCGQADARPGELFFEVAPETAGGQIPPRRALELIKPVIEDPRIGLWGHNLKFDMLMLRQEGARFGRVAYDSFLAAYIIDPSVRGYGLKPLAGRMLNIRLRKFTDVAGSGKDMITFSKVPLETAVDYACADVDTVLRIEPALSATMRENGLYEVFDRIELPLVAVLAEMEWNGVAVDTAVLAELSRELTVRETELRGEICRLGGCEVNPKSPKQVAELLFDKLGLPKKSKRSTDISVLEKLAGEHPVVPLIIEFRQIAKLRGTYVDALPSKIKKKTGRIHTSFNQTLTATGRLSSSDPNLQNIPIRTEIGKKIRRAFVPGPGFDLLLSADYSQIEVRILAHICGDPTLTEAFRNHEDIHRRTAAEVFGIEQSEVTRDQRRYAKSINFGIIYGKTDYGLAQELDIERKEAAAFKERYFARYPKVLEFIETTKEQVAKDGIVTTLFGRRRYIREATSRNRMEQESGFRAAVNTRIQGTAADVMKLAMIKVYDLILEGALDAALLLQVHDELVFEVGKDKLTTVARQVKNAMEHCADDWVKFDVELETDVKAGPNWLDMDELEL